MSVTGRSWFVLLMHLLGIWQKNARKKGHCIILDQLVSSSPSFVSSLILESIIEVWIFIQSDLLGSKVLLKTTFKNATSKKKKKKNARSSLQQIACPDSLPLCSLWGSGCEGRMGPSTLILTNYSIYLTQNHSYEYLQRLCLEGQTLLMTCQLNSKPLKLLICL